MKCQIVEMKLEKETKNTFKYAETGLGPFVLRNLYIEKWAAGQPPPASIKVMVEEGGK